MVIIILVLLEWAAYYYHVIYNSLNIIGIEWLYKVLEDYSYISIRTLTFKILGFFDCTCSSPHRTKQMTQMVYASQGTVLASEWFFILKILKSRTFLLENISQRLNLKQHIKPLLIIIIFYHIS